GLAFVVANDASVMGDDETRVLLVAEGGTDPEEVTGSKDAVAGRIADRLAERLGRGD
ncbi:DNA/pantothenate metabolism flavoprotein, partial [Halorubrum sp. SD626R]